MILFGFVNGFALFEIGFTIASRNTMKVSSPILSSGTT